MSGKQTLQDRDIIAMED